MNTSLMINSTNAGKKYQKAIANINPEKSNAILEEFAQKLTGLSTNSYVGASRVDKSDVTEQGGSGKQEGVITLTRRSDDISVHYDVSYNGDATLKLVTDSAGQLNKLGTLTTVSAGQWDLEIAGSATGNFTAWIIAPATDNYTAAVASYTAGEMH